MTKNTKNYIIEFSIYFGISFLICVLSYLVFPKVFGYYSVSYQTLESNIIITTALCIFGILVLTTLMFKTFGESALGRSIVKTLLMFGLFMVIILAISVASGFMAEIIYSRYSESKPIDEIKRLIDIISKVIAVLIIPIGISIFWRIIEKREGTGLKGYLPTISQYIKLILLVIVLMAIGFAVHLALASNFPSIVSVVILAAVGVVSFYISKRICFLGVIPSKE